MNAERPLEVIVLDVGHGNCSVVRDGSRSAVIDVPRTSEVAAALLERKCSNVEHLLLSHSDADHISGAARLLSHPEVTVGTLWANPDAQQDSDTYIDLLVLAADKFRRGELRYKSNLNVGANGDLDFDRIRIEVLHPDLVHAAIGPRKNSRLKGTISSNRMSAVLRIHLDDSPAILLPGDVDNAGFLSIAEHSDDLTATVLVFPHHGVSFPPNRGGLLYAARLAAAVS